jgi:hypothetical protein
MFVGDKTKGLGENRKGQPTFEGLATCHKQKKLRLDSAILQGQIITYFYTEPVKARMGCSWWFNTNFRKAVWVTRQLFSFGVVHNPKFIAPACFCIQFGFYNIEQSQIIPVIQHRADTFTPIKFWGTEILLHIQADNE